MPALLSAAHFNHTLVDCRAPVNCWGKGTVHHDQGRIVGPQKSVGETDESVLLYGRWLGIGHQCGWWTGVVRGACSSWWGRRKEEESTVSKSTNMALQERFVCLVFFSIWRCLPKLLLLPGYVSLRHLAQITIYIFYCLLSHFIFLLPTFQISVIYRKCSKKGENRLWNRQGESLIWGEFGRCIFFSLTMAWIKKTFS